MKAKYLLRREIQRTAFSLILIAALIVGTSAAAASGSLDPTFGTNGFAVTDLGGSSDTGVSIALQSDGKIIMAGSNGSASILARYNANGTVDNTFGASGKLTTTLRGFPKVALQSDGKLVIGGELNGAFGVARYTVNGLVDSTFGTNGVATAGQDPNFTYSFGDLTIQPDGKIVVVGTQITGGHTYPAAIARFNTNGTLDEGFGTKYFDDTNFPTGLQHFARGVALQTDGRIIFSGNMTSYEGTSNIILGRITTGADPWLDPTFGTNGQGTVVTPLANFTHGRSALAIQADGKIVLAGTTYNDINNINKNLVLARYTSNGTLDPALGGSGIVVSDFGRNEVGNDLAIQADGKILLAGTSSSPTASDILLVRYNSNGSLDTTFGNSGKAIIDLGGSDSALGMVLQSDGKILATGAKDGNATVARYIPPTGAPVTAAFQSKAPPDGWILESTEFSNVGGLLDKTATTFNVGDNQNDRQYRSILSFNTGSLPDNAIITAVQVKIKRQGLVGTDPFTTHGNLLLEIRNGLFSNDLDLTLNDFAAPASSSTQDIFAPLTSGWYAASLSSSNLPFVNKYGVTQFRLRFKLDDNDDLSSDYLKFFSGDALDSATYPQLVVTYVLPQ